MIFNFIKKQFKKIYDSLSSKLVALFRTNTIDENFFKELSSLLIAADTGVKTTNQLLEVLRAKVSDGSVANGDQARQVVAQYLVETLQQSSLDQYKTVPPVLLMVGINGSGKTTFVGKCAYQLKQQGKKVLVVAGDTFRAAATQQLQAWGDRVQVPVFIGTENQDPAAVIFDACKKFKQEQFDHIIIDTAGRLQTKVNLMNELEKIRRIITKQLPETTIETWLTVDAMLGQNSFQQAELFNQATSLNGIVLTKLDGSGKGGIVFSIVSLLGIPIKQVTFGEQLQDIKWFDAQEYVNGLLNE